MQQLQSNPSAAADPAHLGPQILSTPMPGDRGDFGIKGHESQLLDSSRELQMLLRAGFRLADDATDAGVVVDSFGASAPLKQPLDREADDDYNELYRKKHNADKAAKFKSGFKDSAISPSFDPGDFEPDDEDKFDPSKEENHNKLRRDNRYGKLYQDAKDSKVWYSKERSGDRAHAGEHWKRFRQDGGSLIHDADVDLTGKVMSKHKSDAGTVIKLKDTIGIK
jgi:hypothetical protein